MAANALHAKKITKNVSIPIAMPIVLPQKNSAKVGCRDRYET
jgi:hypothetical protein